jgi:hypothetical protein
MRLAALLVLIPAPLLAQHYQPQYQPRYVDRKITVVGVPVAPDYYYSVGEDPDAAAERVADAVLRRLKKEQPKSTDSESPQDGELVRDDFKLIGGLKKGQSLDDKVFAVFNESCIQCHKPGATKPGNVQLFTPDRRLFRDPDPKRERARRERLSAAVDPDQGGEMPKNKPPLRAELRDLIRRWKELAGG